MNQKSQTASLSLKILTMPVHLVQVGQWIGFPAGFAQSQLWTSCFTEHHRCSNCDISERRRKWLSWTVLRAGSLPEDSFPARAKESVFHQVKSSKDLPPKSELLVARQLVFQCDHVCPFNVKTKALCKTWKQFKTLKRETPPLPKKRNFHAL